MNVLVTIQLRKINCHFNFNYKYDKGTFITGSKARGIRVYHHQKKREYLLKSFGEDRRQSNLYSWEVELAKACHLKCVQRYPGIFERLFSRIKHRDFMRVREALDREQIVH